MRLTVALRNAVFALSFSIALLPSPVAGDDALELARALGLSDDDVRPEEQLTTTLFGKRVILGGELSVGFRGRSQFDLGRGADDDNVRAKPEVKLEAIWLPADSTVVFGSVRAFGENELYRELGDESDDGGLALDNLWLLKTGLFGTPLAIQIGRQRLRERREFWWDDSIDGVRLLYFGSKLSGYIGIGKGAARYSTAGQLDPDEKGLLYSFGNLAWRWKKRHHVEIYALHQSDRSQRYATGDVIDSDRVDDSDADLTWLGARARGCIKPQYLRRLCYWADVAQVRGDETEYDLDRLTSDQKIVDEIDDTRVHGSAYDVGVNLEFSFAPNPVLTLGLAQGTGDQPGTPGRDGAFRQTGLHGNSSKHLGLSRFRTYGEVLRPDLSNITISTVALGLPIGTASWLEILWHTYHQPEARDRIAGSPINDNPGGKHDNLGDEIDLIFSHYPSTRWEFELTAGAFRAGSAFGKSDGRQAFLLEMELTYNF